MASTGRGWPRPKPEPEPEPKPFAAPAAAPSDASAPNGSAASGRPGRFPGDTTDTPPPSAARAMPELTARACARRAASAMDPAEDAEAETGAETFIGRESTSPANLGESHADPGPADPVADVEPLAVFPAINV